MPGKRSLRTRLIYEQKWLEKYYNGEKFPWRWRDGMVAFERDITTSKKNVYRLRILVGENYPDQLPELVVCSSPKPMPKSKEWQGTHTTHTWPQQYGLLQICFYRQVCWTAQNMLYQVFVKGEQWLEAYEDFLTTAKPIMESLPTMEPTEEELVEEKRREAEYERRMKEYDRELLCQK